MNERHFDLRAEQIEDGSIMLTQTDCGEEYKIAAHPEQIIYFARRLCGMKPEMANQAQELERRLAVLAGELAWFVTEKDIREEIIDRCPNGVEFIIRLDAISDLATEFTEGLEPRESERSKNSQPPTCCQQNKPSEKESQLALNV